MSEMINHCVSENQLYIPIIDHGRHQANGVATLNSNSKLVEPIASIFATDYPSPTNNVDLATYLYNLITEEH